ncbi:AAA ATPase domain-containing protein [Cryptosporangium aurantiacum]|uniref:AAA ATPase domain-containing protein n=1 Tax=Cryptosporangium aurantiacum TaxID=134849 RepID=A0A1M7R7J4_9ACTN|nr:AAA ATPase domain-containing protein [Cryptosporangium aurantiacum]
MIVVEGQAGIGKSSLLAAVAGAAGESGVRTLRAWGGPLEHDAGWGIARQLFAPVRDGPEWSRLAVGAAGLARRALDADDAEPALAGDAVHAAAHGLTWLACGLAERAPTLLTIDDVHWADAPSLRWLAQLARQLAELRLGILCAVRAGEPPAQPELLAELLAVATEPPVRPRPLGPAAVSALVGRRLPGAGPLFVDACHAASAGNPFLLGALLDHLVAEGVEPADEIAGQLGDFGPEQVARSVERQLARLPSGAGALARALAVLGRAAPLRQAAVLAGVDAVEAATFADQLRAAGLLERTTEGLGLAHPLVAAALYDALPAGERAARHAGAARLFAGEDADPELVALHLLRTEPARDPATVETLCVAAERAGQRGALESSVSFLRRALAEPPPDRRGEADVRSRLGLALAVGVEPEAPDLLATAVELAPSDDQRARIALSGARALGLAGHFDDAVRLCRAGLGTPHTAPNELVMRLDAELVCNAWLDVATVAEARERLRAAMAARPEPGLWNVLAAWDAICAARPASEPLALLAPVLPELDHEEDSLLATVARLTLIMCGDLDAAEERCDGLIDVARPRGWLIALAHASLARAILLVQAGRVRDAEVDGRLAFAFKLVNSPLPALLWSLFSLVEALIELDEPDQAAAALDRVGLLTDAPPPHALASPRVLESRARLRLAEHRPADAHADLVTAADGWRALGIEHPTLAAWRVGDCAALTALGDPGGGRRLAEAHLELADRVGLPGPRGAGLRALAMTVDRRTAVDLLGQAVELLADAPDQLEHVRALVDLGAALRRANQRAEAREQLSRALACAERLGLRRLARRSRAELRAAGARPRRTAVSGLAALTPAEHRVATLAAQGESNREIAQQLYVSRRTVETHLTHVFQKLGLATRADLVVLLSGPGLVSGPGDA